LGALSGPQYIFTVNGRMKPLGIALSDANEGETVNIAVEGVLKVAEEQGRQFLQVIQSEYLGQWLEQAEHRVMNIDTMIIFVRKDHAVVYINFPVLGMIRVKSGVKAAGPVTRDNIADIRSVDFEGVELAQDCSTVLLINALGDIRIFFNFEPLVTELLGKNRQAGKFEDARDAALDIYSQALFPELFTVDFSSIRAMAQERGWFPFTRLLGNGYSHICNQLRNGSFCSSDEDKVMGAFTSEMLNGMVDDWMTKGAFKRFEISIKEGVKDYCEGRYASSISVLHPRIEGMLQRLRIEEEGKMTIEPGQLMGTFLKRSRANNEFHIDLRREFVNHLKTSYFKGSNDREIEQGVATLSRPVLAHGLLEDREHTRVRALQTILILDQLWFYF